MPGPVRGAMRSVSVRGIGWVRMFGRMSVAVQAQDAFCEILFALADVEALHAGQLRKVVAAGQDDRLGLPLEEEGGMLEIYLRRDEIVGIPFGICGCQFAERAERPDRRMRNDLPEQVEQSQAAQRIVIYDGYRVHFVLLQRL